MINAPELFEKNVRGSMLKANWRPIDLARAAGLSPQEINSYLNEGRLPSLQKLGHFAKAFGISIADLFNSSEVPEPRIVLPTYEDAIKVIQKALEELRSLQNEKSHYWKAAEHTGITARDPVLKKKK